MPRILITRAPHQASALAEALSTLGADPILIPTIELTAPTTYASLDEALEALQTYDWLLFTSANAVEAFHSRLIALKGSGFSPDSNLAGESEDSAPEGSPDTSAAHSPLYPLSSVPCNIAAIGPATTRALEAISLTPTLVPEKAIAESLAEALLPYARPGTRFLLVRAEQARDHLPETLRVAGAEVTIAPAYRTIIPAASIPQISTLFSTFQPDAITFTSASTVHNLMALLQAAKLTLPPEIIRASIGPITSQTLTSIGFPPHIEASEPSMPVFSRELMAYLAQVAEKKALTSEPTSKTKYVS